ncbi:MAG: hypothetical protein GWP48_03640 [Actinobacteria bacterium]|nr:hypothetical protein [Actinomycetota bacterium]
MLTIQKASANAAAEAMGMSGMRESAVAYDVLAQASKVARSFRKVVREQGVKRALNLMNEGLLDSDGPQPSL